MYNEHFKIYFIARFFWKIIKIVIIEHYMSILGVIYRNWKQQGRNETNYFMYQWVGPVEPAYEIPPITYNLFFLIN